MTTMLQATHCIRCGEPRTDLDIQGLYRCDKCIREMTEINRRMNPARTARAVAANKERGMKMRGKPNLYHCGDTRSKAAKERAKRKREEDAFTHLAQR